MNTAKAARERVMELVESYCRGDVDGEAELTSRRNALAAYLSQILPDEEQLRCDGAGLARVGAVVLPERMSGRSSDAYIEGWNACLDQIEAGGPLHRRPVRGEPVAWMFPLRYGSGLSFVKPESYEDEETLEMVHPTPLYTAPPAISDAWQAIVEQCMLTEAVTPRKDDPYGTINDVISYHQRAEISEPKDGERQLCCRVDAGALTRDSSEAVVPDEVVANMVSAFWGSPVAGFDSMRAAIRVLDEYRSK